MLMLTLDDAVKVAKELAHDGIDDEDTIRNELEQKCWIAPEQYKAAKKLSYSITEITPREICRHILEGDLKGWCWLMQTEMQMALIQLPCWAGKEEE